MLCAFVVRAVLTLWCVVRVSGARVGGGCGGLCCVRRRACVRCVGGAFECLSLPLWACFVGYVWARGCVSWPLSRPGCGARVWFPATPFVSPPPSFSLPRRLGCCSPGALPGPTRAVVRLRWGWVGGAEGSLTLARVLFPGVSPWGGRCLHSPSGCNSVVWPVHLYPLGTNRPAP